MERTCKRCGNTKPIEEFGKDKRQRLGHAYSCIECERERDRRRLGDRPEACDICGQSESSVSGKSGRRNRLAQDHNHSTGQLRGFLCMRCNRGLGFFQDSPALLQKAIDYLALH